MSIDLSLYKILLMEKYFTFLEELEKSFTAHVPTKQESLCWVLSKALQHSISPSFPETETVSYWHDLLKITPLQLHNRITVWQQHRLEKVTRWGCACPGGGFKEALLEGNTWAGFEWWIGFSYNESAGEGNQERRKGSSKVLMIRKNSFMFIEQLYSSCSGICDKYC